MTANPTPPEQAPKIFGRDMLLGGGPSWSLETAAFWVSVYSHGDATWSAVLTANSNWWHLRNFGRHPTAHAAASAVEAHVLEALLDLAPLLDDAGKRELVKAAGIKLSHFPQDTTPRDFEGELEPFV